MSIKPEACTGIGGVIGAVVAAISAFKKYNFQVTDEMQRGVGYILGGLIMGLLLGYVVGRLLDT